MVSSGQTSCCHTDTARGAVPGRPWEGQAPDDGPDGPVSRPLSGAWRAVGGASCMASLMTGAGGASWDSVWGAPPVLSPARGAGSGPFGGGAHRLWLTLGGG